MPPEQAKERLAQIVDEMKPVRDLGDLRSHMPRGAGILTAAIATENLDLGMSREPGRKWWATPVGEQVNDVAPLQIDEYAAIDCRRSVPAERQNRPR